MMAERDISAVEDGRKVIGESGRVPEGTAYDSTYLRSADKASIPVCNIMGVDIAAINMEWLVGYLSDHVEKLSGDYICVSNVHTVVTAYENPEYRKVQNGGIMAIPDGAPLSVLGRRRGFSDMGRTTGPDLMGEIFRISGNRGYRHFFYGSTEETLEKLAERLKAEYGGLEITGMYSPPFGPVSDGEDAQIVQLINDADADFVWVGLGAPKQERWMAEHQGRIKGLMIGVGAGFDYYAGNIRRAPEWMQRGNLEWVYRLMQEPQRLFGRYLHTNAVFLWRTLRESAAYLRKNPE